MSVGRIHYIVDLKVRLCYLPRSFHSLLRENVVSGG